MKNKLYYKLFLISIFGISMGLLEAIIVVYLKMIPAVADSFNLPLIPNFPVELMPIEQLREAATIVMLISFALLIGNTRWERLALFLWVFAIWDIFYYIFLFLLISWPPSIFIMDVVFLIPIKWYVPFWAVIIVMIVFLINSFYIFRKKVNYSLKKNHK
jgi:hypothetical protein